MRKYLSVLVIFALLICVIPLTAQASTEEAAYYAAKLAQSAEEAGYRLRKKEGDVNFGYLEEGESYYVTTALYYGNEYAICVVGDDDAKDLDIAIYDEDHNLIYKDDEDYFEGIAYVTPAWTGKFYIKVTMYELEPYENGAYFCQFITYRPVH